MILPGVALNELWQIVGVAETALMGVSGMVVVTALRRMMAMIFSSLNERRREVAIWRAMGTRPVAILGLLVLEEIVVGEWANLGVLCGDFGLGDRQSPIEYSGSGHGNIVGDAWRPSHPATFTHARITDVIDAAFRTRGRDRQTLPIPSAVASQRPHVVVEIAIEVVTLRPGPRCRVEPCCQFALTRIAHHIGESVYQHPGGCEGRYRAFDPCTRSHRPGSGGFVPWSSAGLSCGRVGTCRFRTVPLALRGAAGSLTRRRPGGCPETHRPAIGARVLRRCGIRRALPVPAEAAKGSDCARERERRPRAHHG